MRVEQIGDCTLYLGDNREVMPTLPACDLLLTDPPYGIGMAARGTIGGANKAPVTDYGKSDWDQETVPQEFIDSAIAKAKWAAIFGGNYYALPPTSCWLVWDKLNGANNFADCELAWTNWPKAVRRIQWMWHGMLRKGREERFHPTQKPLGVMEWALSLAPASASVLDPWMGSGTTGVACAKTGRSFVGIEREPRYFDVAVRRIEAAYASPDMFIERPAAPVQETLI
jgi:site-specific DNA-methyltransferase (adenine-specific)/modification methylase